MKKYILILPFLIISLFSLGQGFPNTIPLGGAPKTLSTVGGGFKPLGGFVNLVFADTTAANAQPYLKFYNGAEIQTIGGISWNRYNNAWIKVNGGGSGSISLTTTGSTGAATLVGSTLNIPNYDINIQKSYTTTTQLSDTSWVMCRFNGTCDTFRITNTGGGSGGGSPAGNYNNVQVNRNGGFATPLLDSLLFSVGLSVKGTGTFTSDLIANTNNLGVRMGAYNSTFSIFSLTKAPPTLANYLFGGDTSIAFIHSKDAFNGVIGSNSRFLINSGGLSLYSNNYNTQSELMFSPNPPDMWVKYPSIQGDTATGVRPYGNFYTGVDQSYTNGYGQIDAVFHQGYNLLANGGRRNTNEAAISHSLESDYNHTFEDHITTSIAKNGNVNRNLDITVGKDTGNASLYADVDNFNLYGTNSGHLVNYVSASPNGTKAYGYAASPEFGFIRSSGTGGGIVYNLQEGYGSGPGYGNANYVNITGFLEQTARSHYFKSSIQVAGLGSGFVVQETVNGYGMFEVVNYAGTNFLNVDATGKVGVNMSGLALGASLHVSGAGATSATYAAKFQNSSATDLFGIRNDGALAVAGSVGTSGYSLVSGGAGAASWAYRLAFSDTASTLATKTDVNNRYSAIVNYGDSGFIISKPNGKKDTVVISSVSGSTPTLDQVTTAGATTTNGVTVGTLTVTGGVKLQYIKRTTDYMVQMTDYTVSMDNGASNVTVTLPDATGCTGQIFIIKRYDDSSAGTIDITSAGGLVQDIITGILQASVALGTWSKFYVKATFQSNGTNWEYIQ